MTAVTTINPIYPSVVLRQDTIGNFTALPLEMIDHILYLLHQTYGDFNAIARLSQTSRTFHIIAGDFANRLIGKIFPNQPSIPNPLKYLCHFRFEKTNRITYVVLHQEESLLDVGLATIGTVDNYLFYIHEPITDHEKFKAVCFDRLRTTKTTFLIHTEGDYTNTTCINKEKKLLALLSSNDLICVFTLNNGELTRKKLIRCPNPVVISEMIYSPSGSQLLYVTVDPTLVSSTITVCNIETNVNHRIASDRVIECLAFSTEGSRLFAGCLDATIQVWDYVEETASLTLRATLTEQEGGVNHLHPLPNNKTLISLGGGEEEDSTVQIWDSGAAIPILKATIRKAYACLEWSTDCTTLYLALEDGTIEVWDITDNRPTIKVQLVGHTKRITSIKLSTDQKILISGSDDETIRLWDAKNYTLLRTLPMPIEGFEDECSANAIFPQPNGTILSTHRDGTIRLYPLS